MRAFSIATLALGLMFVNTGDSWAYRPHLENESCVLGWIQMKANHHYYCPDTLKDHTVKDGASDGHGHAHPAIRYMR